MATDAGGTHSQKVEVHLGETAQPTKGKSPEEVYGQMPARFLPKEGYELIGSLVKVDPTLAKHLTKLLKGVELTPDEDSPTGYREKQIPGVIAFCNNDGVEKISDFLSLHINTPLSYKERGYSATGTAGKLAKQFNKDIAANFERWEITNPSLIPQIVSLVFQFIRAAQGQSSDLPEGLLSGGALRPKAAESPTLKVEKGRIGV